MKVDAKFLAILIPSILVSLYVGRQLATPVQAPKAAAPTVQADPKVAEDYKKRFVVEAVRENAKKIQVCYLNHLEKIKGQADGIKEGVVTVLMKVNENGSLSELKITKNQFSSQEFGECVIGKFSGIYLAPPPVGMNRYISHDLAFKTQETAEREAKERAEKSRLPKILPKGPEHFKQ